MVRRSRQILSFLTIALGVSMAVGAGVVLNSFIAAPPSGGFTADSSINDTELRKEPRFSPDSTLGTAAFTPNDHSETVKLGDPAPSIAAQMGFSVDVSGDTAIVGAPGKANNRGSAFIFVRNGVTWVLQQEIMGVDSTADDNFGWSVAISGETALVGAYDLNEVDQGAAYVFVRNGLTWSQQQKLLPAGGLISDQFGSSVSINGDTTIVGAFGKDNSRGAAYVYSRTGSSWAQQQILSASDGAAGDEFGWWVEISGDRAVIGAPGDDSLRGGAYVFSRNGSSWSQAAKIVSSDGAVFDRFGYSSAIDGTFLVVGAPLASDNGILSGAAYVFSETGGTWQQQDKLLADDRAANDKFGGSVAIFGSTAVIGSNGDDLGSKIDQGSAYLFTRADNDWTQTQKLSGSDGQAGDNFGGSVSLSSGVVIAGAYLDDGPSILDPGSAYIFTDPTPATAIAAGQVFTSDGRGLRGARVTITDVVLNTRVSVSTSSLGYFEFHVANGRDYVISVSSKRYRYSPLPVSVNGDHLGIEMIGLE